MKLLPSLLSALLAVPSAAFARLGETPAECIQRYGPALEMDAKQFGGLVDKGSAHSKNGIIVLVYYAADHAELIVFKKEVPEESIVPEALSQTEIATLLEANGNGENWKDSTAAGGQEWIASDRRASYDMVRGTLTVMTNGFMRAMAAKTAEKEKDNLSDF